MILICEETALPAHLLCIARCRRQMQSYKWMSNFYETISMLFVFWSINWSNLINIDTGKSKRFHNAVIA